MDDSSIRSHSANRLMALLGYVFTTSDWSAGHHNHAIFNLARTGNNCNDNVRWCRLATCVRTQSLSLWQLAHVEAHAVIAALLVLPSYPGNSYTLV